MKRVLTTAAALVWAAAASAASIVGGAYDGNGCPGGKCPNVAWQKFQAFVGSPVIHAHDEAGYSAGCFIGGVTVPTAWQCMVNDVGQLAYEWQKAGVTSLTINIPMLMADDGSTFEKYYSENYGQYFSEVARLLISHGYSHATVVLGWEMNISPGFPWYAGADLAGYRREYRAIVATMRFVPGQEFRFAWVPLIGPGQVAAEHAYPGDDVVDLVGADVYNIWPQMTPAARWAVLRTQQNGLDWLAAFAAYHYKPLIFPEWGTGFAKNGQGAGDDSLFVNNMVSFMLAHPTAEQDWWDWAAGQYNSQISRNTLIPNSAAAYRVAWPRISSVANRPQIP